MIIAVDDASDSRLDPFRWKDRQLASTLQRREAIGAGLFVAEGDLVVERAIALGFTPVALLCDTAMGEKLSMLLPEVDVYVGPEDVRRDVTGLGVPLKATGLFQRPPLADPDTLMTASQSIVIAEAIDNPTNLGVIVRSAAALGWDAIILDHSCADPLARRALRVSMGTGLAVKFARLSPSDSIASLLTRHHVVSYALTPDPDAININSVSMRPADRIALLLGSERDGLTPTAMVTATHMVRIAMHSGVDSLNVGAAAAIALHALGPNSHQL